MKGTFVPALIIFITFMLMSTFGFAQQDNKSQAPKAQALTQAQSNTNARDNTQSTEPNKPEEKDSLKQFKGYDSDGNEVLCSQEDTVKQTVDGKVVYRCRSTSEALGEDSKSDRGEGETNELIDNLLEQSKQTTTGQIELKPEQVRAIEQQTSKKETEQEPDDEQAPSEPEAADKQQEIHLEKPKTSEALLKPNR